MEKSTGKADKKNRVAKAVIKLLFPLVVITEIGIFLYYTMLWKNAEKGFIIEDFYMRSSRKTMRRVVDDIIEAGV